MAKKIPTVALLGRTNVGKSTLFNALIGRRFAVVDDESGVTRDRNHALIRKEAATFTLIDTAGLFADFDDSREAELQESVRVQTELAMEESDLVIVLFDGLHGIHPKDQEVVSLLRQSKKAVIWVVNKCEKPVNESAAAEFYALGIDTIHPISAAHRKGIKELIETIGGVLSSQEELEDVPEGDQPVPLKIAILGKPNVGKSTVINKILGEERLITSDIAGTTRDNIDVPLAFNDEPYVLIDTAGLRKKARVKSVSIERYSNLRTLRALARCEVAVLLLDATEGVPTDQDLKIATLIHERGRGLVIAVNKWDLIEKDHRTAKAYRDEITRAFRGMQYAPILFVSGQTGKRCTTLLRKAREVHEHSKLRLKTAELNKVLTNALYKNPPPVYRGEPVKLYFATQIDISPPTFVLFFNFPRRIDAAYQRYLKNAIRDHFPFEGCDLKFLLRKRSDRESHQQNVENA